MSKVAVVVMVAGLVAAAVGGRQLPTATDWFPVCEQGKYWYDQNCSPYCEQNFMETCRASGGTVACCWHYPNGPWQCQCIAQ
ncbi:MAG: hypothetical protein QHJ34_12225 [bacterium]|jgi:hypothetical protein|nr:hypothetical protein [candidate division KSB1 bacterium]MDH7560977.1 hypothetical protein [bacterium]